MGRNSGGVMKKNDSKRNKSFTASVSVVNYKDETRWLQKKFRTEKQARQWVDKVANKFSHPGKAGFATYSSIDRETKRGTIYDYARPRDLSGEFWARERRKSKGTFIGKL